MKKRNYKELTEKFDRILDSIDNNFIEEWLTSHREETKINQVQDLIEGQTIEFIIESEVSNTMISLATMNESDFSGSFCEEIEDGSLNDKGESNYAIAA